MKSESTSSKEASNVPLSRIGGDASKQGRSVRSLLQIRLSEKLGYDPKRAKADRHGAGQTSWIDDIASCPVYYPTAEEFNDPLQYIQSIASEAATYGMCKIVSPLVASIPAGVVLTKEKAGFKFTTRTQPLRLPEWTKDDKTTFPMSGRNYSLTLFEKMANRTYSRKFSSAATLPARLVEAEFWAELVSGKTRTVEYACDVEGSAFSTSHMDQLATSKWNLKGFSQLSKSTLRLVESAIPGVTEPMLYIGMLFSMFAWHVEDHYLYSINYHHCGAPKTWYGVPGNAAPAFEKVVQEHVYNYGKLEAAGRDKAFDLLLGKTTMFPSKLLTEHGVPVFRTVQSPGEFVITFPQAYHSGFSHGFNCGEAVNFAMADWFPFGAAACQRYKLINRIPLLSQEELLCKEAMVLCLNPLEAQENASTNHQSCVKAAFVRLMRSYIRVQSFLKQKGALCITSNAGNVLCAVCRHVCYISYTSCNCSLEPCCLNHGKELRACICGSDRSLFIRENFAELEAVVSVFEREDASTVSVNDTSSDNSFAASMLPVEELIKSQLSDGISPRPIDDLYSGSYHSKVNRDRTQLNMSLSLTNRSISEVQPCNPVQSEFLCILTRDQGQEEESFDGKVLRLKRQRVSKQFQSEESVLNRTTLEVHQLCATVESKEPELKAPSLLGPDPIKEISIQKKKEGQHISRLIVRGPAAPPSTDTGKKEDGISRITATNEARRKQISNNNPTHKGLDANVFFPRDCDCPVMTFLNSKEENDDAGPALCDTEMEAGPSLETGLQKALIIRLKIKQSKTSFSTGDIDMLQNQREEKKDIYMLESAPNHIADDIQAGSVTSLNPDQDGRSSLMCGRREVGWLPQLEQTAVANETCFIGDMRKDEPKDDSTTLKVEESDVFEDDTLEEGELKEPSGMLDYAASIPHVKDKSEEHCNHSQSASNFREDLPPHSPSAVEMKSSGWNVREPEVVPMVNEEQKLWQADYPANTSPTSFKNEMCVNYLKHARWHHKKDLPSQQISSSLCPDMAQPSGYRSIDCSQPFSDYLLTGSNSLPRNQNLHQEGKMWISDKFLDTRRDQRRWYSGQRSKTTPLGNEVGSCTRWWGPPGSHFPPSSTTAQTSANFFVSDRTRSGPARNHNGSEPAVKRNSLPSSSKSFHHHHHHEPKRATFTPHRQANFPMFQKKRLDAHSKTRQRPYKQLFWVNKGGAQSFQSSTHNRM